VEGSGLKPQHGDSVSIHFVGSVEKQGVVSVFDRSPEMLPFSFTLGQGRVLQGWEVALKLMRLGERSLFELAPSVAFGEDGMPPQVPPNSSVLYEIELVEINRPDDGLRLIEVAPLERDEDIAPENEEDEEEDVAADADAPNHRGLQEALSATVDDRIQEVVDLKEKCKKWVEQSLLDEATMGYYDALDQINQIYDTTTAEQEARMQQLRVFLHCNAAFCHFKQAEYDSCKEQSRKAIAIDPSSSKAHYRLGMCELQCGNWDASKSALERALELAPNDAAVKRGLRDLKAGKQSYLSQASQMARKMLGE